MSKAAGFTSFAEECDLVASKAGRDHEAFRQCLPYVTSVGVSRLFIKSLNSILAADLLQANSLQRVAAGADILLWSGSNSRWYLTKPASPRNLIYFSPNHMISMNVGDEPLIVKRYAYKLGLNYSAAESVSVESETDLLLGPNQCVSRDGSVDSHEYQSVSDTTTYVLRMVSANFGDVEWGFDKSTGLTRSTFSVKPREDALTMIMDLLAEVGDDSSLDSIIPYAEHPAHYVRWAAIRSVILLNESRGKDLVEQATNDSHPHVASAAKRTLQHLRH